MTALLLLLAPILVAGWLRFKERKARLTKYFALTEKPNSHKTRIEEGF